MLEWSTDKRKLGDLAEWSLNPRQVTEDEASRLRESLSEFGQVLPICIDPDDIIIDGHQRRKVWGMADEFGMDFEVDVRVASRRLTEAERKKLTVFLEKAKGGWDFDKLANHFEVDELLDWGFEDYELGMLPEDEDWDDAFGDLPDGDRAPFQQKTFTLHDLQVETVDEALRVSKGMGDFVDSENENSNGNALARICETYITDYGKS